MTNMFAATLGPLGVLNDHMFRDPAAIAISLRLVAPATFCWLRLVRGACSTPIRGQSAPVVHNIDANDQD